jgi:hypothetical protein
MMESDPGETGALPVGQHHSKVGHQRRAGGERRVGDRRAGEASGNREHHTLRHQLSHDPDAGGAERRANRDFTAAAQPAHDHQVGEVDTHDQQHCADRHEEQQHRAANQRVDPLVIQRNRRCPPARIVLARRGADFAADDRAERLGGGPGLLDRHPGLAAGDHKIGVVPLLLEGPGRLRRDRNEQLALPGETVKAFRQHPDDRVGHAVQPNRSAKRRRITRQSVDPEAMSDHGQTRRSRAGGLLHRKRPSEPRGDPEQRQVAAVDELAGDLFGCAGAGEVPVPAVEGRGRVKRLLVIAEHAVLRVRPDRLLRQARGVAVGREQMDQHQLRRLAERQRLVEDRESQRQDGDGGTDADRQHRHGNRREGRLLPQRPYRVSDVLAEGAHDGSFRR